MFFAEEGMLQGMLVCGMWAAVMHEGMREVFVWAGAQLKDMELVSSVGHRPEEGVEKR